MSHNSIVRAQSGLLRTTHSKTGVELPQGCHAERQKRRVGALPVPSSIPHTHRVAKNSAERNVGAIHDWPVFGVVRHRRGVSATLEVQRRTAAPIGLFVISLITLVATARIALASSRGQLMDQRAMESIYAGPDAKQTVLGYLGYISIGTAAAALVTCVVFALVQGRLRLALAAVIIIAGANVTTQVLKYFLLDRPDLGFSTLNSLPSGHTTVVTSVVLATLLVAPPALRPLFAIAGSFVVTLTGSSTVAAGWHRPGDIIAALAVCLLWASAVAFFVGVRSVGAGAITTTLASLAGAAAAGIFLIVVGVRPTGGWEGVVDAAIVLGVIGALTALMLGSFARFTPN